MHKTAITSRQAFLEFQPQIAGRKRQVYDFVKSHPRVSNREISMGTGIEIGCVTARVNELVNDDSLLKTGEKSPCVITKKNVYKWELRSAV